MDAIRNIQPAEIDELPIVVKELPNASCNHNGYLAFLLSFVEPSKIFNAKTRGQC